MAKVVTVMFSCRPYPLLAPGRNRALPWVLVWLIISIALGAGAGARVPWTTSCVLGSPNPPASHALERLFPKLSFDHPVDLALLPGSDRWFVVEQSGRILSFDVRGNPAEADLAIDLRQHHQPFDSAFALAFHPGFATNRFIFLNYNEPGGRTNGAHVSRFIVTRSDPPLIDPASERVIIRWLSGGHNGCTLAFGPDGCLYISTGDATNPDPPDFPYQTGQDISDLLSSILRIDVDRVEGTNAYAIPPDNPFIRTSGACPEVWAYGFRNPWRMSFGPDGALWVGDVGWELWEMVYRVQRGGNYGWSIMEGPQTVRQDIKRGPTPILAPLLALPHSEAASITGGYVYQGRQLSKLRGAYVYGDWETGKFWALRHDGDKLVSNQELCDTTLRVISFAPDQEGELMVLDYNGGLYRLVSNEGAGANVAFPRKLSETGLFADTARQTFAAGVEPYRIAAEMWNDDAIATRFLGVPGTNTLRLNWRETLNTSERLTWPTNAVLGRTLALDLEQNNPATRRRIETQLLHFDGQSWNAYSYRWNREQTDAHLVAAEGATDLFIVKDPRAPGGRREQAWRFASRVECLRCHNPWAGNALAFNVEQLRARPRPSESPSPSITELERLETLGLILVTGRPPSELALADPYDPAAQAEKRARAWLHANCAHCHRWGAGGSVSLLLNHELDRAGLRAVDQKPQRGDFGIMDARVIAAGDPYRSTLFYRINSEGSGHMPLIGARLVDEIGVRLVCDWIRALPVQPPSQADAAASTEKLSDPFAARQQQIKTSSRAEISADGIQEMLSTMNGALALLDILSGNTRNPPAAPAGKESGGSVPAAEGSSLETLRSAVVGIVPAHTNALIRDLFQRLLPPELRRRTLGADIRPELILALAGSPKRGQAVFHSETAAQCARCHRCGEEGRDWGPNLTGIAQKYDRARLLDEILHPSKFIAPEFRTTMITLRDGTELSGLISKRGATERVLRDEQLMEKTVKEASIKESRESELSAMPEGLLAGLTAQEAADLLEYLMTR